MTTTQDVSSTFTSSCTYGCKVRVVDGVERPHICDADRLISDLVPDLSVSTVRRITTELQPLVRRQLTAAWEDGIRAGRAGVRVDGDRELSPPPNPGLVQNRYGWRVWLRRGRS